MFRNPEMKILNSLVQISFSTSKHIVQRAANRAPADEQSSLSADNHILLFTIYDTDRPITVETIYRITFSYGSVLRIVIFRKSQVQVSDKIKTDMCFRQWWSLEVYKKRATQSST